MPRWRTRLLLLAAGAGITALGLSLPAFGAPESLLPPGFGSDQPPPAQVDAGNQGSEEGAPTPIISLTPPDNGANEADTLADNTADAENAAEMELPKAARRSIDFAGPLEVASSGFGTDAFGGASGPFLSMLMRRLDAPIASRWLSITLRRALLSRVPTPRGVDPADWIAERAWLLLRMGEADAARMLVQQVDVDRYTPKMFSVAQQVALATADPAALCPIADGAMQYSKEPAWTLAKAMCAGLSGDGSTAMMYVDKARQGSSGKNIDVLLAEKVVGAGVNTRRAVHVEWDGVDKVTAWRFGLASATGVDLPKPLLDDMPPHVHAWRARAPLLSPQARLPSARIAATLGVLSSAALVDLYAQIGDAEGDAGSQTASARLRAAYVGDDDGARMTALRSLWDEATTDRDRYGSEILTARAAAGITPDKGYVSDTTRLVAAMLSAGLDLQAMRWGEVVDAADKDADPAWAMLAVGTPRRSVTLSEERIDSYGDRAGSDGRHRAQLLIAALDGLGRLTPQDEAKLAGAYELPVAYQDRFTRAIDTAASQGAAGTVVLLAAVGMQTANWGSVSPVYLYHIVSALRRTGQGPAARMIAAEAIMRS